MNIIVQRDHPVLRENAKPVDLKEIGTAKIKAILSKMNAALHEQKDGIALAAPQIGESLQIFILNDELLEKVDKEWGEKKENLVFINPEIIKYSKDKKEVEEGCLSVRWLYGTVKRSTRVTIRAYNEKGEKFERGAKGILAQIFQHETDHLKGILFTDRANELWEMSEDEIAELSAPDK